MGITQIEYDKGNIYLFERDGNHVNVKVEMYNPHFWVLSDFAPNLAGNKKYKLESCSETTINGEKLVKVINTGNYYKKEKEDIVIPEDVSFERDISPENRYILDKQIKFDSNYRILFLDIETEDGRDPLNTPDPIICIGLIDGFSANEYQFAWREDLIPKTEVIGRRTIFYYNDESEMINGFFDWLNENRFDIVTCWNSPYDIPYIINRCSKVGVDANRFSYYDRNNEENIYHKVYCGQKESKYNKFGDKSLTFKIFGIMSIDLLKLYRKINVYNVEKADSFKLDDVAKFVLNEQKLKHGKFKEMWRNDFKTLLDYNIRDVQLIYKLEKKLTLITGYLKKIQDIVGAQLDDCMQNSKVIDFYVIQTFKHKYHFPSKKHIKDEDKKRQKFEGAFVQQPEFKLYKNICAYDFSGEYPNVIRTFNISPDTKVTEDFKGPKICCENCVIVDQVPHGTVPGIKSDINAPKDPDSGLKKSWDTVNKETRKIYFRKDFEGIFTQLVSKMIETRYYYKKKWEEAEKMMYSCQPETPEFKHWLSEKVNWKGSEDAQKALINSFFGVTGYNHFRFYDVELGGSITGFGRQWVKIMKELIETTHFEGHNFKCVYSDTDSNFFYSDKDVSFEEFQAVTERFLEHINTQLPLVIKERLVPDYDVSKGWIKVGIAYQFKSLQFVGVKKRYAGILVKNNREFLYARGFEIIRKDTPQYFKTKLSETFKDILSFKKRSEILENMRNQLTEMRKLDKRAFGMPKNFSMKPEEYKNLPQHLRALNWCNQNLGTTFDNTDALSLYFVKHSNRKVPPTDVIVLDSHTEFPDWIEIDYERYFDFFVIKKLKDLINIESKDVLFTRSLMDFM